MDVAGELGQRAALGLGHAVGDPQPCQLPRQQDRHHAQVLDDRQQQPAQALAVAPRLAAGMQGPDLVGRIPAFEQAGHRRELRHNSFGGDRTQSGQVEQQRGDQRRFVGAQAAQRAQRVGDERPRKALLVARAFRIPRQQQVRAQRGRHQVRARTLQQGMQTVDGRAGQGRSGVWGCRLH